MNNRNGRMELADRMTAIAMMALCSAMLMTGCVTGPSGNGDGPSPIRTAENFKPYELNLAQRAVLNVTTQYVDRVTTVEKVVTNTAVFVITNTVVVEKPVIQQVAGLTVTNMVPFAVTQMDTQAIQRLETTLASLTNHIADHIAVSVKKSVGALTGFTSLIPGYGQLAGAGLAGALALFAGFTQKKLNASNDAKNALEGDIVTHQDTTTALAQEIQVGRNLLESFLSTTPAGQKVGEEYTKWLQEHQAEAGVLGHVVDNVLPEINDENAQFIALKLAGKIPPVKAA